MTKVINPVELHDIIDDLNNQKLDSALKKLKVLPTQYYDNNIINRLFASIYFKKMDWLSAIEYYEKIIFFEKEKFKIYSNIGVAYFKLGKINKSIDAFKNSIIEKSDCDLAYNNLGISYLEIGMYQEALNSFISVLKINKNDFFAKKNIINLFNLTTPENVNDNSLIDINYKINKIISNHKIKNFNQIDNIKKILDQSNNIIEDYYNDLSIEETQIYRTNSRNLNCKRHFRVFNEFNKIPKFCFSCYKVQINLINVIDLIKLYFIFNNLHLKNNNIRKCIVEIRENIKGNYKGYIYCEGLSEAQKIEKKINKIMDENKFNNFKITIKHGCTEFYKTYPKYEKINFNGDQEFRYNKNWKKKEDIVDGREPPRLNIDKKVIGETIQGINLSDILIIKNWIRYADIIEDYSYKLIYKKITKTNMMDKILNTQIEFRKKNSIL